MRITKIKVLTALTVVLFSIGLIMLHHSRSVVVTARKASELQVPDQPTIPQAPNKTSSTLTKTTAATASQTVEITERTSTPTASPAESTGTNKPVALVNGIAITTRELDAEFNRLLISPNTHADINTKKKEDLRKIALDELIVRELAYQHAKSSGFLVSQVELTASEKRIRHRYKSEKDFQQALAAEQITEQELQSRIERDLLLKKVFQVEIEAKAKVTEADIRRYYDQNRAKFLLPESLNLEGILIRTDSSPAEAKRKIDDVFAKLKAGADFGELAYKVSEDDYRVMSGNYGSVHRGQLIPELESVAFAQKPGEVSRPFKTSLGWQVIKVQNKQPERELKYEEVREKIKTALQQQREKDCRLRLIDSLKATAKIDYVTQ